MVLRLEVLALQKYTEVIKELVLAGECKIRTESSADTVQKIRSNFAEVKGLAAIVVSVIYSHSKTVLCWETMKKVLKNSLHHFEVLEQKYYPLEKGTTAALKESTASSKGKVGLEEITLISEYRRHETHLDIRPNCNTYKYTLDKFMSNMLAGGNEMINPAEEMLMALCFDNIKEACAFLDSHAKEILNNCNASRTLSLKNGMLRTIEELESITTEMKSIQVIQMTIKKYMDTGPYKTWKEVQIEFLQHLIQQPRLHLYANQLSEILIPFFIKKVPLLASSKQQKMMIEACLHPAITELNANEIPLDILLELLPKFKDLNILKVKIRIIRNEILKKNSEVFSCMRQYCYKLKCLCITFQSCSYFAEDSQIPLKDIFVYLPTTLISLSFYGLEDVLDKNFLGNMPAAEKFNVLKKLTLSEANDYPLHRSFRNLVAVEVIDSLFRAEFFWNIGGQLKELSLSGVLNIQISILAKSCPSLENLSLKYCTFSSSFHQKPLLTFSSLKEIFFIPRKCAYGLCAFQNICNWCILQNSPEIEKIVVINSVTELGTCFQKLMKTNQMRHLQEFELYRYNNNILKGLINTDFAVQMINKFPTLSFIGGIEHAVTQRNLSEIYSNKIFVNVHEKTIQHVHKFEKYA